MSSRRRRGPPGPLLPPGRAPCCSSSRWRGPAPLYRHPATASTRWSTPTGRTPLILRTIHLTAWNRTTRGCCPTDSPAAYLVIFLGSGLIAASRASTRARRTMASVRPPCPMVSRLCTRRGSPICRTSAGTINAQGRLVLSFTSSRTMITSVHVLF